MEIKNTTLHFTNGVADCVPVLTQWDSGQTLTVTGLALPAVCEFGFKNGKRSALITVAGIGENGKTVTKIPNELLCEGEDIIGFIIASEDDSTRTVYSFHIKMRKRDAVEETSSDPQSPHYIDGLAEVVEAFNAALTALEQTKADALSAATKAEESAAAATAVADTLSPADAHYDPESWIAQSGVAVAEAAAQLLSDTKNLLNGYIHKDFINADIISQTSSNLHVPSAKAAYESIVSSVNNIEYNGYIYAATTVGGTLDGLMSDVLGLRDHSVFDSDVCDNVGEEPAPYTKRVASCYAVKQYVDAAVGNVEAALDGILQIQNALIGGGE